MTPQARERGIAIPLSDDLPEAVDVDGAPLDLVLRNILDNAIKFSPAGGRIDVRIAGGANGTVLTVADQGPGIGDDELPFLFDRFFRGHGARADGIDGVGLGLALCLAILRAYGGKIEVSDQAAPERSSAYGWRAKNSRIDASTSRWAGTVH